ncbi:ribonuclease HII [Natrialba aegyptia]|uniref:Ribonuclease HII n=1 Tax=Natrialba aegyptia DSM 13077 TaxID=1227491 RepID=M0B9E9_9EURY|nr:ribonuclease HII [Natrialba aegyptia]ELZ07501.1 ribonuclease HII [Natrialba aegyptia DSM 13077]
MPFGVDEAGKGPALGSMFAAAVHVETDAALPDGIADSKRLAPARRDELADTLRADDRIGIGLAEITPAQIDDPETDMNSLTVRAHAQAIESLSTANETKDENKNKNENENENGNGNGNEFSADPLAGLCDACDTDAERFARRVTDACTLNLELDARHGADEDSPIVGAASIVAKVARDAHVETIADEFGSVGSGYPSDPTTREFLERYVDEHGELPPVARTSWATCEDVLAAAEQTGLGQF